MDLDFTGLRYRVDKVPMGTDLIVHFRELADIKEFSEYKNPDRNYLIRYIIYLYSPGSPFFKKYTDLAKRKEACADFAGYDRNAKTGKFTNKNIYKVFEMSGDVEVDPDEKVEGYQSANPLIFAWLRFLNDFLWSEITVNEQLFVEYTGLMLEAIEGRDSDTVLKAATTKSKLRSEIGLIRTHLGVLYKEFFGESEAEVVVKAERIRPETVFKTLKVG